MTPEIIPTFIEMLDAATKVVKDEFLFKKFIQGTPLENDIPVWMAEFTRAWLAEPYGHYLEKCDESNKYFIALNKMADIATDKILDIEKLQAIVDKQREVETLMIKILEHVLDVTKAPPHVRKEIKAAIALTATDTEHK